MAAIAAMAKDITTDYLELKEQQEKLIKKNKRLEQRYNLDIENIKEYQSQINKLSISLVGVIILLFITVIKFLI